jgi:carbon-monoxide dehydrogenase small subunit
MKISLWINDKLVEDVITPGTLLIDSLRKKGCYSVKRGCDTANCGLCTVLLEGKPVLSCSVLAARANGKHVTTIEGIQEEAAEFGAFLADQGSEQCGFCSPGFIMNVIAMTRELENPSIQEIKEYLAGNLCRCTGYQGQLRAIQNYINRKKEAMQHE